jgi:uncharacterized repeat protein (TIGR01451 family)
MQIVSERAKLFAEVEFNFRIIANLLITKYLTADMIGVTYTDNMYRALIYPTRGLLIAVAVIIGGSSAAASDPISIKAIAEVEQSSQTHGRETGKLIPADRVVSGDTVFYTLEVRNTAPTTVPRPVVTYPIPTHMTYLPDSAVGPGTQVTYSVDAGRSFDAPENLRIQEPDGQLRAATAADYTHIRWQLKNALKGNSVAFVRFRARVK